MSSEKPYQLTSLGAFRLTAPDGRRVDVRSKKSVALLGLLATARTGERTRAWIQDKLWGTRELGQAQASLRRELHNLRKITRDSGVELISSDSRVVRLNLDQVQVDIRAGIPLTSDAEFLEGLDLAGEEGFEEWLRETRHTLAARRRAQVPDLAPAEASTPPEPELALALLLEPIDVVRHSEDRFRSLPRDLSYLLVKCLSVRKWLPILLPHNQPGAGVSAAGSSGGVKLYEARYVLEPKLLIEETSGQLLLHLTARPGPRLLRAETLEITRELAESGLHDSIARLCNSLLFEVFYAETRRIQSVPVEELNAAELTHLVRHFLGQVSIEGLALARSCLDRAMALRPCTAEQVILDAYIHVMSFMGSEYTQVDPGALRSWASIAMNADPTDWRGTLLASVVELWLGNPELAVAHAQFAKELSPYNGSILGQLGTAYVWSGQPEAGIAELDMALSLSLPERRPYLILCNLALAHLMQDRLGQALSFCDQAATCVPELGLAYMFKIAILVRLGRNSDAARVYRESIRDKFDDLIARVRRQRVLPEWWVPEVASALEAAAKADRAVTSVNGRAASIALALACLCGVQQLASWLPLA